MIKTPKTKKWPYLILKISVLKIGIKFKKQVFEFEHAPWFFTQAIEGRVTKPWKWNFDLSPKFPKMGPFWEILDLNQNYTFCGNSGDYNLSIGDDISWFWCVLPIFALAGKQAWPPRWRQRVWGLKTRPKSWPTGGLGERFGQPLSYKTV